MHCWQSLPQPFLDKLTKCIPSSQLEEVLPTFCMNKPITIRVNTLKIDKSGLKKLLERDGIKTEDIPWYKDALKITIGEKQTITHSQLFTDGYFYIQSLSSMIPALVMDPQKDEKILDLCASPGSKTTQMATMMKNTGEILANDRSRQRLFKLSAVLQQQGVTNTKTYLLDGERMWQKFPNYFDKTLVDAPCSMEGRFQSNDVTTYKDWSPKKVKQLAQIQKSLLRSAYFATKPGGIIVYSTCTLSPEENEEVVAWLLEQEKENVVIEEIPFIEELSSTKIFSNTLQKYEKEIHKTLRILPSIQMEGFYVAKIRRIH